MKTMSYKMVQIPAALQVPVELSDNYQWITTNRLSIFCGFNKMLIKSDRDCRLLAAASKQHSILHDPVRVLLFFFEEVLCLINPKLLHSLLKKKFSSSSCVKSKQNGWKVEWAVSSACLDFSQTFSSPLSFFLTSHRSWSNCFISGLERKFIFFGRRAPSELCKTALWEEQKKISSYKWY